MFTHLSSAMQMIFQLHLVEDDVTTTGLYHAAGNAGTMLPATAKASVFDQQDCTNCILPLVKKNYAGLLIINLEVTPYPEILGTEQGCPFS